MLGIGFDLAHEALFVNPQTITEIEQVDFSQSRDLKIIVGDGPRLTRDSYLALGEQGEVRLAAANPQGARGTARLLPGTGEARENHPGGLEVEFEINCP